MLISSPMEGTSNLLHHDHGKFIRQPCIFARRNFDTDIPPTQLAMVIWYEALYHSSMPLSCGFTSVILFTMISLMDGFCFLFVVVDMMEVFDFDLLGTLEGVSCHGCAAG